MLLRLRGTVAGGCCCSTCRTRKSILRIGMRTMRQDLLSDPLLNGVDTECDFGRRRAGERDCSGAIDHDVDLITVVMRDRNRLSRAFGEFHRGRDRGRSAVCSACDPSAATRFCRTSRRTDCRFDLNACCWRRTSALLPSAATQLATQIANHLGAELHAVYVIGDYFEQISAIFPEGGLAALTRLRSYVQERMAQLSRTTARALRRTSPKADHTRRSSNSPTRSRQISS